MPDQLGKENDEDNNQLGSSADSFVVGRMSMRERIACPGQ